MKAHSHSGHRKRLYSKIDSGNKVEQHELLEALLFNVYPRTNTNPIAHSLLNKFGDLKTMFNASIEDLCSVDGIGEQVAYYIQNMGIVYKYRSTTELCRHCKTRGAISIYARNDIGKRKGERINIYILNQGFNIVNLVTLSSPQEFNQYPCSDKLSESIRIYQSKYIFIAHYLDGDTPSPTEFDSYAIQTMLQTTYMLNLKLLDYSIFDRNGQYNSLYCDSDALIDLEFNDDISKKLMRLLTNNADFFY